MIKEYLPLLQVVLSGLSLVIIPLIASWWRAMRKDAETRNEQISEQVGVITANVSKVADEVKEIKEEQYRLQLAAKDKELADKDRFINADHFDAQFRELKAIMNDQAKMHREEVKELRKQVEQKVDKDD